MISNIQSADGVEGVIIHSGGEYWFRVYTGPSEFKDYDLAHTDLTVKINDADAVFYEYSDGTRILDHSATTLGIAL